MSNRQHNVQHFVRKGRISSMQKLTIVIPAYNEQEVLKDTV
ncbi:MAG: glycosyltransferase, partial [Lacticaseibacillus paracasei]